MAAWTDEEFGDVAQALDWPRERVWRYPIFPWLSGPDQPAQLDGRLSFATEGSKAAILSLARDILEQRRVARSELFDGLPQVTQADTIKKDERYGYESRKRVILDMQSELARLCDYYVNPAAALSSGQPMVIG